MSSTNGRYGSFTDLVISQQEGRRLLAYHNARRHGVAGRHTRQNGSIRNTKAVDAINLQLSIDHRHRITAHFRSAGLMPVRNQPISKELPQFWLAYGTGRHFTSRERAQRRRIADLAGQAQSGDEIFQILRIVEIIGVNRHWIGRYGTRQVNNAAAVGPHST